MSVFVALLRAVNVGGTGKLPMEDLRALCAACGFTDAATYIASGNVVFRSALPEAKVKAKLEAALAARMGKPVGVMVRTAAELEDALAHCPFRDAPANRVMFVFIDTLVPDGALDDVVAPGGEQLAAHGREVAIFYPGGMGTSKLKAPFAKTGTGRNRNTVEKLAQMARALEQA
jgi:uncharacterized protein (DUF1697 family)